MKNNKGFSLVELLAVIAILSILTLIAVPNAIKIYNEAVIKEMQVQEGEVKNAANIYLTDHCLDPIPGFTCPATMTEDNFVCLSDLQEGNDNYIGKVLYKKKNCDGVIVYNEGDVYENGNTYLFCDYDEDKFNYATNMDFYVTKYASCFTNGPKPTKDVNEEESQLTPIEPTDPTTLTEKTDSGKKEITISYEAGFDNYVLGR